MKNFEEKAIKDMSTVIGGQTDKFTVSVGVDKKRLEVDFTWEPNDKKKL